MFDAKELFESAWQGELEQRKRHSPSYGLNDYTVTGRAPAAYGGKRGLAWWQAYGPKFVQDYADWRKRTMWDIWITPDGEPAIELGMCPELPNGIPVQMHLDRVFVPVSAGVILDIKTGRQPETPEQLGLYATGIELRYGKEHRPSWGCFWVGETGRESEFFNLDKYTPEYFARMYDQVVAGINAKCFLPQPANACGRWCGVSHFCSAVNGPLAEEVDPLVVSRPSHQVP
jgi:putative RecB family exonuclease